MTDPKAKKSLLPLKVDSNVDQKDDTDLNLNHQKMCSISVGINTAFVLNRKHTFSFNFKNKIGQFHKSPPSLLVSQGYDLESCALHLEKDYHRYKL